MSSRAVLAKRTAQSTTVKAPQTGNSYGTQSTANRARPPGSSMAGQVAFSQAQQQYQQPLSLQQQQQMGAPPRKVGIRPPSQTPGPQLTQQQQYNAHFGGAGGGGQQMPQRPQQQKISVESAIALTTMRLSVAEQNIIDIQSQIGDILMNGMMGGGAGFDEYDEEGNPVPPSMMGAGGAQQQQQMQTAAPSAQSSAQLDALKKEVDDLKVRFALIEKTTKDLPLATNNAMTMIKKLSADNLQFKNQITQLTNMLNKSVGDMDRKFNEMSQTIATLEYAQQQQPIPDMDDGVHLELSQIHGEGDNGELGEDTPLFTTNNPMIEPTTVVVPSEETPIFMASSSANEPMKITPGGARRGGAAAAAIAAASGNGGKRAPANNSSSSSTSIDL